MPKQKRFTPAETKVFTYLNIEDEDKGLKNLIRAQREVNGMLCQAIWATIRALEHHVDGEDPSKKGRSLRQAIQGAKNLTRRVAQEPPGCNPKNPK